MIHVVAELHLHPGARDAFVAEFRRLTPLVRAEAGCLEYAGTLELPTGLSAQAPVREDVLVVVEKWASREALAAHLDAPHMAQHRARSRDLVREAVIRVSREI